MRFRHHARPRIIANFIHEGSVGPLASFDGLALPLTPRPGASDRLGVVHFWITGSGLNPGCSASSITARTAAISLSIWVTRVPGVSLSVEDICQLALTTMIHGHIARSFGHKRVKSATKTGQTHKNDFNFRRMAGAEGLEPTTLGFGDRCSTN